jgi:hypothetical protein
MKWCVPGILATLGSINRRIIVQAGQGINIGVYLCCAKAQTIGSMAEVIGHLLSKCKDLSSNYSTAKKKKKKDKTTK